MPEAHVSVVIPTVGREALLGAVESVLSQTKPVNEVIIAADTRAALSLPSDPRIKVVRVGPGAGGNVARQVGIQVAMGPLVALLDDDDQWRPQHLARICEAARLNAVAGDDNWFACSFVSACYPGGKRETWPTRSRTSRETLPQYIFRKHRLVGGIGFVQASTLMFPRALALRVPFDPKLKFHQDVDWLVRVSRGPRGAVMVQVPEATVDYHVGQSTVSRSITADASIQWGLDLLDPNDLRTLGDFILVTSLQGARNQRSVVALLRTMKLGTKVGRPGVPALVYALSITARTLIEQILRTAKRE